MAQGLLSKNIKLGYKAQSTGSTYSYVANLQEIPEIGNGAPEKIETTILTNSAKTYIAGLTDSGQDLAFKVLYDKTEFGTISALSGSMYWRVEMPDGVNATFQGTPSVKFDGVGTNAAITYTLTVTVESEITFHNSLSV